MGEIRHSTYRLKEIHKVGIGEWLKGWKPIPLCRLFEKHGWEIPKYLIGGGDAAPEYDGPRISDSVRSWEADEDLDVVDWVIGEDFCFSVGWGAASGKKSNARELRLRWRNVSDSGTFADLAATGELNYTVGGATSLTNDDPLTEGESGLVAAGKTYSSGIEREDANAYTYSTLNELEWAACMWAINTDDALAGKQYEFELYNITDGAQVGLCLAQITMLAGAGLFYELMEGSLPSQDGVTARKTTQGRFQEGDLTEGPGVIARKGTLGRFQDGAFDGAGYLGRIFKALRLTTGITGADGVLIRIIRRVRKITGQL